MGVSPGPGSACQPPHTPPVSARESPRRSCRCLVVTPREISVHAFYGVASHSVAPLTLYFGDGPPSMVYVRGQWKQLSDTSGADAPHEHAVALATGADRRVAVSRVGIPGDGMNPWCSGGSAVRFSIGKAGQLECRRTYAKRLGCQYEGLGLQACSA